MDIIWKRLKILTFPFNSYYSFSNPNKKTKEYEEIVLFNEVGEPSDRLDKIKLLRNTLYRSSEDTDEWVISRIKILSEYFLTIRHQRLYVDENDLYGENKLLNIYIEEGNSSKKYLWYYLKRVMNKDFLKASFINNNLSMNNAEISIINSPIFTIDPLLEKILDKGISENHMHAGAARNFSFLWIDVMNNKAFKELEIWTYEGLKKFKNHLLLTQLARIWISIYLQENDKLKEDNNFEHFIPKKRTLKLINHYYNGKVASDSGLGVEIIVEIEKVKSIFSLELRDNSSNDTIKHSTLKNDVLTKIFDDFYCRSDDGRFDCKYGNENSIIFPENVLLLKSFKYLQKGDNFFRRIFVQYIRVKNIFEQYIRKQDNDGKGLDVFTGVYRRQKSFNYQNTYGQIFYTHFESQNIKKMEIRLHPKREGEIENDMKLILNEYLTLLKNKKYNETDFPLIGVIFHFKKEISKIEDKCYHLFDNQREEKYLYFGDIRFKNKELALAISGLINRIPEIGNYIVGIDAASCENDSEPYVFKEIYEIFRTPQNMFSEKYTHNRLANTLGFTYHVGEEFRDIMSGLRHIDEIVEHFNYIPGDRIGHGIVIGIDIDKWSTINSTVLLPINEYLDNLLWEWGCYYNNKGLKIDTNISYLENRIFNAAIKIFGYIEGITIRDLYDVYLSKFNKPPKNVSAGCIETETSIKYSLENGIECQLSTENNWNKMNLIKAFNCKYFLKSFSKNVSIKIDKHRIEKYKKFQEFMQNKLSERGVVIEINPTSNLLIGDFDTYKDFHIENISSPINEKLIVTINTDDPITFNTKLSNEYSFIMDFMLKENKYSRKEILNWIDKLRENSNNFSFIKDRGMNKDNIIDEISRILDKL